MTGPVALSCEEGVGRLTLDHPPLNILTRAVLAELRAGLARATDLPSLRVLLLSARGRHFSAGADVEEHLPPEHSRLIPEFVATIREVVEFPLPVIAAVQGRCLGGGFELAQAADLIVAAEDALFGQPEIQLGVLAPAACAVLPRLVGRGAAAELLLTGDPIDAAEAHRLGLVARVVAPDRVDEESTALAQRMARHTPVALRLTKRALRDAEVAPLRRGLELANDLYLEELMSTEDALEGLRAFVEKREPVWAGR